MVAGVLGEGSMCEERGRAAPEGQCLISSGMPSLLSLTLLALAVGLCCQTNAAPQLRFGPDGTFRIVQFTDLHAGELESADDQTNQVRPSPACPCCRCTHAMVSQTTPGLPALRRLPRNDCRTVQSLLVQYNGHLRHRVYRIIDCVTQGPSGCRTSLSTVSSDNTWSQSE